MTARAEDLPAWAALPTALLLLAGAGLALTGSLGLLRLGSFYQRVHAPTLGTTLGIGCILAAWTLFFSVLQARLVLHGDPDRGPHGRHHARDADAARARGAVPRPSRGQPGGAAISAGTGQSRRGRLGSVSVQLCGNLGDGVIRRRSALACR